MRIAVYILAFLLIALPRMHFTVLRKSDHQYLRLNGVQVLKLMLKGDFEQFAK